jgi:CxxC motif-containing protein/NADPH-dependent 2,4-dienoyl-CoA reductase/sulfur reductase-like enzyme
MNVDLAIIGGGPAGLAAAIAAYDKGIKDIVIIERDKELGGILSQCIHHGFGLHTFGEELTGPEYALRYIALVEERKIPCLLLTMVVNTVPEKGNSPGLHRLTVMQAEKGQLEIVAKAVVLAMGCRERPRGALNIPGYRPAGIYTAGCAQRFVNIEGYMPGRSVVVLGSGDIGLIMARRLKLQGADVRMVAEIMPYSGGLTRNIVQCLEDYDIPLRLSHTIIDIDGKDRLKGVTVAAVDENLKPILDTAEYVPCDTLLLSCGLIPENELSHAVAAEMDEVTGGPVVNERLETTVRGIFACGNVLHVHDLVDNVSLEATACGNAAADYIQNGAADWGEAKRPKIPPKARYSPPKERDTATQLVCIGCPASCFMTVDMSDKTDIKVSGNSCKIGEEYARKEMTAPTRNIASLVRVDNGDVVSVKTASPIPKGLIFDCMREIRATTATAPVRAGEVLIKNVAGTGIDIIATANSI